ncbi:LodA/GoxA family CTQ-dependent oxidase [Mycobacterium paragordonae]|uniref:LodA/GoxA family CTQ-dependent oxidase n=1 Tax=Mycobacterium paragordonae TaxID=1389713 RepID=UPI00140738C2|nr:LodA/GoxA family CTQ-dependent oxidase [Mycobacterium paragordonae]
MNDNSATQPCRYRIHPGVGIARLGDSATDYFIGPEAPNWHPAPPGGYKDAAGKIRRQGARFRIYEYDESRNPIREITASGGTRITWTVHLANKKGSWYKFVGRYEWEDPANHQLRNASVEPASDPNGRQGLIIDPGVVTVEGRNDSQKIPDARFLDTSVSLGELHTDRKGRLIVLGGSGCSAADKPENLIVHFANNDGWHDDTSDGVVRAHIQLEDGTSFEADPAWVVVAPPKYVPTLDNLVTLDDTVRELYTTIGWLIDPPDVDFDRDIAPLLDRVADYSWVSAAGYRGHGPAARGDFKDPETKKKLRDKTKASADYRRHVFSMLRTPLALNPNKKEAARQASPAYMPPLSGDAGDAVTGEPATWMTVLPGQYERLKRWAEGKFVVTSSKPPDELDELQISDQPEALDRAALQSCVGGPFYPGIEMTFICQERSTWRGPYRIADDFKPGDITRWMAVPWQADFYQCMFHWWPVQRPDEVLSEELLDAVRGTQTSNPASDGDAKPPSFAKMTPLRVSWIRGLPQNSPAGENALVKYWSDLGFVEPLTMPSGEVVLAERGRAKYTGVNTRDLFYALMNIDSHVDVLPAARAFVEQCLAASRRWQTAPDTPYSFTPFSYSPEHFASRMKYWYNELVAQNDQYDPAEDVMIKTLPDLVERLRQFGPFNMTDGAWLLGIGHAGPMDLPHALSFSVFMDELGDGDVRQNHANLYEDLLHSVKVYPADCASREFVYDPTLLDSAFDLPSFQLAIAQFSQDFFPEILGMTVYLEFSIIEVNKTIDLLNYYGVDPHYFVLHVGIDNPANGHSARAMQAVNAFLDKYASSPAVMESLWRRIWDGFVAFYLTGGTFGVDLRNRLDRAKRPSLRDQVATMIKTKAEYGQLNHRDRKLANAYINTWFSDPYGFMDALIAEGLFIKGDPDKSKFFELTKFETGPMFRVFTDAELKLWADWCRELGQPPPPPPGLAQPPTPPAGPDPYPNMVRALTPFRVLGPYVTVQLSDPDDPETSYPFNYWAEQPASALLAALASPTNELVVPGDPERSPILTDVFADSNIGRALHDYRIPGTDITAHQAIVDWITDGPEVRSSDEPISPLWLAATSAQVQSHPTGVVTGMGAIH